LPIANGVLTTEDDAQAKIRATDKGRDTARVAVEMANLLWQISPDEIEDEAESDIGHKPAPRLGHD
jgi:6,7-dimethyl-8-ribityllumazine synthase